jgi:hypothetical protein
MALAKLPIFWRKKNSATYVCKSLRNLFGAKSLGDAFLSVPTYGYELPNVEIALVTWSYGTISAWENTSREIESGLGI